MKKKLIFAALAAFSAGVLAFGINSSVSYADGNGSPNDCLDTTTNVKGSVVGTSSSVSYDVGSGKVVKGVCIKSGSNMFGGNQHSGVLSNGTYENGCYKVEGVGTQVVTVTRLKGGSSCQGISHIDVVEEVTSDYCDPTQRPRGQSIGQWVPKEVRCVEPNVNAVCGALEGAVTNLTPFNYGISWSEGSPDYNFNTSLPATFPEDYNGGSVEVFYWVVGAEADYVTGRNIPNFWEQNAASVTIDTDCDKDGETPVVPEVPAGPQSLIGDEAADQPQVDAPGSGVKAGAGSLTSVIPAVLTFLGSIGSLAYGLVRFAKFGA